MALAATAATWTGGRGDGNRGAFANITFPKTPSVVWKSYLGPAFVDVPPTNVILSNNLLIVAYGKYLLALAPETGEVRWLVEMAERPLSDLLLLDGQILVTTTTGNVTAYNPAHGEVLWHCSLGGGLRNGPVVTNDLLFFTTKTNNIQVVERKTGKLAATTNAGEKIEAAPALMGSSLLLCFSNGRIMRAESGISRWSYTIPNTILALTPVTDGRQTAIVTTTNAIISVNPYDRTNPVRWAYLAIDRLSDSPTLDGNHLYFASRSGVLHCLDASTGRDLWHEPTAEKNDTGRHLPAPLLSTPLVFGSQLLARMDYGLLALLNKDTGDVEWIYRMKAPTTDLMPKAPVMGWPAIDGAHIYFAGSDGNVYHLSTTAPDIDPPTFSEIGPAVSEKGFIDAKSFQYVGAIVDDEGAGLSKSQVTMRLDATDLSQKMQYDAKSGYYFVGADQLPTLDPGMHKFLMTAKDYRGNVGTLTVKFIIGSSESAERVPVSITGEFLPKRLRVKAGTIVSWTNNSGGPRTIISDAQDNGKPLFTSDNLYPEGIPTGETWVWIVPNDAETDSTYYYHCRLNGKAGDGTSFGTGLVGVIEIGDPVKDKPLDKPGPGGLPGPGGMPGPVAPGPGPNNGAPPPPAVPANGN